MSDLVTRLNTALEGRYHIERELGEGGMATVYLADDVKHERKVALKVLKPELAAVVGAERFLAEIKTTASLQHPHILPLHDSGEADGFLFYVMPYVEGETLRDRIDREKQLPVDEALGIAIAVAGALQTAHDEGIVHRDVKPANILLSRGEPLVADFGIALAVGAAGGNRLTETGLSVGTPYYMSPEQATGDQIVGPASDTYALGCVLYELLVGEPPYLGNTAQAVLGKIIQGAPVSATSVRKSIPPNVDAAIRKALERIPADRFTSTRDFAKALADPGFRHGEVAGVGDSGSPWNRLTRGFAATTAVLATALGWAVLQPDPPPLPAPIERFSLAVAEGQTPDEQLNVSPDGSMMVYRAMNETGRPQLYLRQWDNLDPVPIPDTEGDLHDPVISPDGQEVAYVQDGLLKVAPLRGGLVRTLADQAVCCSRWGVDGYLYFSPVGRTIRRVPIAGGEVEQVTARETPGDGPHGYFQVLQGGEVGVFTAWSTPRQIEALNMTTGQRTVLTEGVRSFVTSTGHLVFATADGRILAAPFDAEALQLTRAPVPLVDGLGITTQTDAM
jgi:serine/threonine-protein kinase